MKKLVLVILIITVVSIGWAARKALIIGNSNYADSPLRNPVNDANLIAGALRELGFTVTLVTNADLQKMDTSLNAFITGLGPQDEAIFYYSGHGANYNGENFLIPIGRAINAEEELRYHAFSSNMALDRLQKAKMSVVILDACRDNPYRGARSGSRGLASMQGKAGSQFIIYSTEQGKTAADGTGNNSPFTEALAKHIKSPDRIEDVMKKVTREVKDKTYEKQIPWTAGNLIDDFYFKAPSSSQPQERKAAQPAIQVESTILTGTLEVESNTAGDLYLDGNYVCSIAKSEIKTLRNVPAGSHELELRYDGKSQKQSVSVLRDQSSKYAFNISKVVSAPAIMVYVEGGTFQMGSNSASNEKPVHQVTLSSYYIGKYEVTQKEWQEVMGSNPSYWKGDNLPVEKVSWYDVLVYCNKRSLKEGLTPCYSISGNSEPSRWDSVPSARNSTWDAVTCNWSANGYRLPTEAEWEYAARGGNKSKGYRYSGSNDIKSVAWYWENSGKKTHSVGGKQANELGIYDMSGNVLEWCWDGYNESYYSKSESRDPRGSGSGKSRVQRGSSWSGNDYSCRVAYRASGRDPENGFSYDGFRVLRAIK